MLHFEPYIRFNFTNLIVFKIKCFYLVGFINTYVIEQCIFVHDIEAVFYSGFIAGVLCVGLRERGVKRTVITQRVSSCHSQS